MSGYLPEKLKLAKEQAKQGKTEEAELTIKKIRKTNSEAIEREDQAKSKFGMKVIDKMLENIQHGLISSDEKAVKLIDKTLRILGNARRYAEQKESNSSSHKVEKTLENKKDTVIEPSEIKDTSSSQFIEDEIERLQDQMTGIENRVKDIEGEKDSNS